MSDLRLYSGVRLPNVPRQHADSGLRFFKFFGGWNPVGATDPMRQDAVLAWLDGLDKSKRRKGTAVSLRIGTVSLLAEASARLAKLATSSREVRLATRLLTGLGLPHPSENGLLFHSTLAVPYIRGTALKQAARNAAEWAGACPKRVAMAFGAAEGDTPLSGGQVAFLDALPIAPVTLAAEQITNHYPGHYQGPNPALGHPRTPLEQPADWYNPVPVTLLALETGVMFRVGLRCRDAALGEEALGWLLAGLADDGVGARTTLGFGRLEEPRAVPAAPAARAGPTPPAAARSAPPRPQRALHPPAVGTRIRYEGDPYTVLAVDGDLVTLQPQRRAPVRKIWDPDDMEVP